MKKFFVKQEFYWRKKSSHFCVDWAPTCFAALVVLLLWWRKKLYTSQIIVFLDQHALMSKMWRTILREIASIAAEKLGALLAKLPHQRRLETDNYTNFSVPEKVFLRALVECDKSPLVSPQETLLKSFCRIWLSNLNMDLWSFTCLHSTSDADLAKDNLTVSRKRKWCNVTGTE